MPYRHTYEHIPAQVWTKAPDGMLDYANAEASAFMGVPDDRGERPNRRHRAGT